MICRSIICRQICTFLRFFKIFSPKKYVNTAISKPIIVFRIRRKINSESFIFFETNDKTLPEQKIV